MEPTPLGYHPPYRGRVICRVEKHHVNRQKPPEFFPENGGSLSLVWGTFRGAELKDDDIRVGARMVRRSSVSRDAELAVFGSVVRLASGWSSSCVRRFVGSCLPGGNPSGSRVYSRGSVEREVL